MRWGQQTYVLLDAGASADAVELVKAARELTKRRVPPVLDAWLFAAEAEVRAAVLDKAGAPGGERDGATCRSRWGKRIEQRPART
jgi:hypothetical protein